MYIFYDFETSSRELTGQILSYAFVITDQTFTPIDSLTGLIKLNRTQFPEVGAILTNKINVLTLQEEGDPEYLAAEKVYSFIASLIDTYQQCTLIGFNSNQFDLSFLRTLLIRYGFNPYFKGKLKNIDILHWSQYLAFQYPDKFPWVLQENEKHRYYSFKLEDLCHATNLLSEEQSHDALEDVLLTIKLTTHFQTIFNESLLSFIPFYIPKNITKSTILKQKSRHFASPDETPEKYTYNYYLPISLNPKSLLLIKLNKCVEINLTTTTQEEKLKCLFYANPNKYFFNTEECSEEETIPFNTIINQLKTDPFFDTLKDNPAQYFELIKKKWDIDLQIHELGFDRITTLFNYKTRYFQNKSSYTSLLKELLANRTSPKDNYLIQLFNRIYLNTDPAPDPSLLKRYLIPRYVDGTMSKDINNKHTFSNIQEDLHQALANTTSEKDLLLLEALKDQSIIFEKSLT